MVSCIRILYGVLIGCALLAGVVNARAQTGGGPVDNPCAVPAPNFPVYYQDLVTADRPFSCMPAPGGPGVKLTIKYNTAGVSAFWYCPDNVEKPTKYRMVFGAATWARMAEGNLTPDTKLADPSLSPVWCPFHKEMQAATPVVAVTPAMKVAVGVAFNVEGTTLKGVAGSVAVGTECSCAPGVKIGSATYCTFTGAAKPTIMASCKAAP